VGLRNVAPPFTYAALLGGAFRKHTHACHLRNETVVHRAANGNQTSHERTGASAISCSVQPHDALQIICTTDIALTIMAPDRVRTNTREKPALFVIATVVVALFEELLS